MTAGPGRHSHATTWVRYALDLASAQLIAAFEVVAIVVSLHGKTVAEVHGLFSARSVIVTVSLVILGTTTASAAGIANLGPSLQWFTSGQEPSTSQRQAAVGISLRQTAIIVTTWVIGGAIFWLLSPGIGLPGAAVIGFAVLFGATAAAFTGLLRTQRSLRPLTAAADPNTREMSTGLGARLLIMWTLCGLLPSAGIAGLLLLRSNGWILEKTASLDLPMLVFTLAAVPVGLRAVILISRSITDPVREVVDAMAEVERGRIGTMVDVYERAEMGRLQSGFNSMVGELRERDRLRDLFGRYVGVDVARRAVDENESSTGEVRQVAILFIDVVDSTVLTATRPPEDVAIVLNEFFRIVVAAVDEQHGLINKFQGDAVLAVFGAPLRIPECESAAMSTARALGSALRQLSAVDFGIGVSAGPVFAGNIGAENRYEYTVIGDAVNEAARLADRAKAEKGRILCSGAALARADATERQQWTSRGSAMLRGRTDSTLVSIPVLDR
jgi:adenylate cyclase